MKYDLKEFYTFGAALEKLGCSHRAWKSLQNCNIPIPLLLKAVTKGAIPDEFVANYIKAAREEEERLERPLFLIFSGDIGNYKTLMAIRILVQKLVQGYSSPLFLRGDELLSLYRGETELQQSVDELTFAVTTAIGVRGFVEPGFQPIPFTSICRFYDVILIDDLEDDGIPAYERILLQAYNEGSYVILTTNLYPDELTKQLSEKAVSRLSECGTVLLVQGTDKRRRR